MSENEKNEGKLYPKDARDIFEVLKQMQGQLDSMEKKINDLAKKSRPQPFKGRQFGKSNKEHDRFSRSKPARSGGRSEGFSRDSRSPGARPFPKKSTGSKGPAKGKRRPFSKDR